MRVAPFMKSAAQCEGANTPTADVFIGHVRFSYNPYFSACFFSRNSVFLSQQISRNSVSSCFFSEANGAIIKKFKSDRITTFLVVKH